jgi:hypothetical protein
MAITITTPLATLPAGAPALGPAGQFAFGPGDVAEPAFMQTVTITGDGAATTILVNWIDGVLTLPFTPTGVRVSRIGGTDTSLGLPFTKTATNTNLSFTVNFTVAPANTTTQLLLVEAYK